MHKSNSMLGHTDGLLVTVIKRGMCNIYLSSTEDKLFL